MQGKDLGSASKDLFEAIERGDFPQWDIFVQIMEDHEHPELDWDPLDDTKIWPEDKFPLRMLGVMTLNRNVDDHHNENEQIAMGTGVLVDGLDFSDDKMLVGRTFSYSDTQRHRVGTNYLQLPVNQPKSARVATNQRGGQMSYGVDLAAGQNPHVNFEPHIHNGLHEAQRPAEQPAGDSRPADAQRDRAPQRLRAGARALLHDEEWERDDLVKNMGDLLGHASATCRSACCGTSCSCTTITALASARPSASSANDVRHLAPLAGQVLTDDDQARLQKLGSNGDKIDPAAWGTWTGIGAEPPGHGGRRAGRDAVTQASADVRNRFLLTCATGFC